MKGIFNLSNRKKEVLYTVASNFALQVVTALCGFVLPPLVIGTFGSSINGMVSSITQFIAYLNIVEAGVGGAAIAALYKPLALGDKKSLNGILSATVRFYNRSGILFTVLIFILAFVYPLIVGNEVDRIQSALMVLVLGITGAAEFFLIGKYRVLLTADKKLYVISLVQMFALIVSTALSAVLIKTGFSIVAVKLASALVYLGRYGVLALYVHKKYTGIDFHAEADTQAISQSKNVLVHQIGALVVFNSPMILITVLCSLRDASIYSVYTMIFCAIYNLLNAFTNGIQSFFGESFVNDSLARIQSIFDKYETIFILVGTWFYYMAYLLILPFMKIYTMNMVDAQYLQPTLALLLVFDGVLNSFRSPYSQVIFAVGHFKETQLQLLFEVLLRLLCSIAGAFILGMNGGVIGGLCAYLYRLIAIIVYSCQHILKINPLKSFLKTFLTVLYGLIIARLFSLHCLEISNYRSWFFAACLYGFLGGVCLFPVYFITMIIGKRK